MDGFVGGSVDWCVRGLSYGGFLMMREIIPFSVGRELGVYAPRGDICDARVCTVCLTVMRMFSDIATSPLFHVAKNGDEIIG